MTPPPTGPDEHAAIAQAIQDVTEKAQLLVREEIELAKAEVESKVRSLVKGAVVAGAAGGFVLAALLLLVHGFAWFLWWALPFGEFDIFWGFLLAAGIFLLIAVVAGLVGLRWIKKGAPPTPDMAIDEAKLIRETVQSSDPRSTL